MKYSFQNILYQLYSVLLLLLLFLFQNCCMVQFILLKPLKSNFLQFLEEAWTGQCVECKVPRELLLHTDQLMPPLEIGENWIWEIWGERNGPCNTSGTAVGVTVTAVRVILWVLRWMFQLSLLPLRKSYESPTLRSRLLWGFLPNVPPV